MKICLVGIYYAAHYALIFKNDIMNEIIHEYLLFNIICDLVFLPMFVDDHGYNLSFYVT